MTHADSVIDPTPTQPASKPSTERVESGDNSDPQTLTSHVASTTSKTTPDDSSEVIIAVMGATGSGKTTIINAASNSKPHIRGGLESYTSVVQIAQPFELDGRMVTLIDTPGFDDTNTSDADILRMIAAFLATVHDNGKTLAGLIFMHRISDLRTGGISTRNFKMLRQLCGESTLKNIIIVTNMWSEVSEEVGAAREAELASGDIFFKPMLDKGAQMLRHDNTPASAHAIISRIIKNQPIPLQIQSELVDQKMDIADTAAGEELTRELKVQLQKHKEELRALQEEMQEAIRREKDERTGPELDTAICRLEERWMAACIEIDQRNNERTQKMQALHSQLESSPGERAVFTAQMKELRKRDVNGRQNGGMGLFGALGRAMVMEYIDSDNIQR